MKKVIFTVFLLGLLPNKVILWSVTYGVDILIFEIIL